MPMPELSDLGEACAVEEGAEALGEGSPGCKISLISILPARKSEGRIAFSYLSLQVANKELLEGFPGLVAVADVLESLGSVLSTDIEHHLLTTARADGSVVI